MIGNDLNRRKFEVVFISWKAHSASTSTPIKVKEVLEEDSRFAESWIRIDPHDNNKEIEEDIIAELVTRHEAWINGG